VSQRRRQFTDEFKGEAVALLVSSGRPLTQIAGELGYRAVDAAQLARAGRRAECRASVAPQRAGEDPHSVPDPAVEISQLRRENDRLQMERDILKKHYFSSFA